MPATRRTRNSTGPAAKGAQKTLSFGSSKAGKPTSFKEEKIATPPTVAVEPAKDDIKPSVDASIDVASAEPKLTHSGHVSSESAVAEQTAAVKAEVKQTPEEVKARKVSDAQIKRYWREREAERKAPRVHQDDLSVEEKVLRLWDMSSQYGPAIGIARMKRWTRAHKLGLMPPIEVLAVLLKEEGKGNSKIERAHVDELMSSKFVVGEA